MDQSANPDSRRARSGDKKALLGQALLQEPNSGKNTCKRNCRRALDVIVEAGQLLFIPFEKVESIRFLEILPLQQGARKNRLYGSHEFLDKRFVSIASQSPRTVTKIQP